jgi:hypothetical protein
VWEYVPDSSGSGLCSLAGCCEKGNGSSVSIKGGGFLDWVFCVGVFSSVERVQTHAVRVDARHVASSSLTPTAPELAEQCYCDNVSVRGRKTGQTVDLVTIETQDFRVENICPNYATTRSVFNITVHSSLSFCIQNKLVYCILHVLCLTPFSKLTRWWYSRWQELMPESSDATNVAMNSK